MKNLKNHVTSMLTKYNQKKGKKIWEFRMTWDKIRKNSKGVTFLLHSETTAKSYTNWNFIHFEVFPIF